MEEQIASLIIKKLNGEINAEESLVLQNWIQSSDENQRLATELLDEEKVLQGAGKLYGIRERVLAKLNEHIGGKLVRMPIWKKISVAASILLVLGLGSYFAFFAPRHPKGGVPLADTRFKNDVSPGGYKAKLTLADGRIIVLDSAGMGELVKQGNTVIINKDGQLIYIGQSSEVLYNTLSTSKGEIYTTTLSDGSKIWLNSASSIRFPVSFTGSERRVEITGEAYFEVAKDAAKKFIVTGNGISTEVLGTHFNVNTYTDEESSKVTLLEGSVRINNSIVIKPGQQAQVAGSINVADNVDLDEVMAWKNGFFQFKAASIETIMKQAMRWYDVNVVFEGTVTEKLVGEIPRNVPLSSLLKMLERTDVVRFKIEGKKVTVMPNTL